MKSIKINFCFPNTTTKDKGVFIDSILKNTPFDLNCNYAGYKNKKELKENFLDRFDEKSIKYYKPLSPNKEKSCKKVIIKSIKQCHKLLPTVKKPISVFVFPWLPPFDKHDELMGRVTGFVPMGNVINIYIASEGFSLKSLHSTIIHEYNHALFFSYQPLLNPSLKSPKSTIGDILIWEGLAENFVESIMKKKSIISKSLTEKEARLALSKIGESLLIKIINDNSQIYENLFFGGKNYKKWTGYSLGYYIVKSFLQINKNLSWNKIIQTNPKEILDKSPFTKGRA